jgi:hypothetical protein
LEIQAFFNQPTEWKSRIGRKELDIYIPSFNIAVEIDGWYWHQNIHNSDVAKNIKAKEMGIELIRVRERPLPLISELDISYDYKDDHFKTCSQVLARIGHIIGVNVSHYGSLIAVDSFQEAMTKIDIPKNNLRDCFPDLSKEWHPHKNGPLKPENFARKSNQKVWWMCFKGHEWEQRICVRSNGNGCPYCSNRQGNIRRPL